MWWAYSQVLDIHFLVPLTRQLVNILAMGIFYVASDGIVCSTEIALGLEFEVGTEASLGALDVSVVTELVFHCSEKDAARIHVGLCDETILW